MTSCGVATCAANFESFLQLRKIGHQFVHTSKSIHTFPTLALALAHQHHFMSSSLHATSANTAPTPSTTSETYIPAPIRAPRDLEPFHLNGTQDMLTLFELMPLYDRAVRPYLRPVLGPHASEAEKTAANAKRNVMPKTFMHYVPDVQGRVRVPKRTNTSNCHNELTHILMKPEYTYTPILPLDSETLHTAFHIEPTTHPIPGIDMSLLDADEQEMLTGRKTKSQSGDRPDAPKKRVVLISKKKRV